MTDNGCRVEAFWVVFGGVTIPYGGVLGSLLAPFANRHRLANGDVSALDAWLIGFYSLALIAFFAAVPVVCLAVVRKWRPGKVEVAPLGIIVLAACTWLLPALEFGMPTNLWRAATGSWLACCLALAFICRVADIKKSIFR